MIKHKKNNYWKINLLVKLYYVSELSHDSEQHSNQSILTNFST